MTGERTPPLPPAPGAPLTEPERALLFERIHRSPRIPDHYAGRRAVSR